MGTNLPGPFGDGPAALAEAARRLAALPGIRVSGLSAVYRTEPQGLKGQPWFHNQAARLELDACWSPERLLAALKDIEAVMGRIPGQRFGPRAMDLDILLYGDERRDAPELTLPHPRMALRAFVLLPLRELCPDCRVSGGPAGDLDVTDALARLHYRLDGDRIYQD